MRRPGLLVLNSNLYPSNKDFYTFKKNVQNLLFAEMSQQYFITLDHDMKHILTCVNHILASRSLSNCPSLDSSTH